MNKILGTAILLFVLQPVLAFLPTAALDKAYAGGGDASTDINYLKSELEEEKEGLAALNEELEFMVENIEETRESIEYLNTRIGEMELEMKQGDGNDAVLQEELKGVKEELDAEILSLGEMGDELEALNELQVEAEEAIAKLTSQIHGGSGKDATKVAKQTNAKSSEPSAASTGKPKPKIEALKKQLAEVDHDLQDALEELDDSDSAVEMLEEEIQETLEEKEEIEEFIVELLAKKNEIEKAIESLKAKGEK